MFLMRYEFLKRKLRAHFVSRTFNLNRRGRKHLCELLLAGVEERNMTEHIIVIRLYILVKFFNIFHEWKQVTTITNTQYTEYSTAYSPQPSISIIFIVHRMHSCILIPLFAAWVFKHKYEIFYSLRYNSTDC